MQAYEHIFATMLMLAKGTDKRKGLTLEENLSMLRKMGAYYTYPDSVRSLLKATPGIDKAFRQPSHFTDGAYMIYITGDELKNAIQYPIDKVFIPEGLDMRAADGLTDLITAKKYNEELFETVEGSSIFRHLLQDSKTDQFFQGDMAECYIDPKDYNAEPEESVSLYGEKTKGGLALFKQTGKVVQMGDFRQAVAKVQELTTLALFRRLRIMYPDISFEQIQEAANASYDTHYPPDMLTAKAYVVPKEAEQERILHAIKTQDYSYYDGLKKSLVDELGAFSSQKSLEEQVEGLLNEITSITTPKDKEDREFQEHE